MVRAIHSVRRRHLGEGEAVFRQGDNGASLFTVDEGQLDVVKEHGGVSRTVARLVPGEHEYAGVVIRGEAGVRNQR